MCIRDRYPPEEGKIFIDGEEVKIESPQEALRCGISMIHQELNPIPYRSVTDNIWVGRFEKKGLVVNEEKMKKKTEELLADLELSLIHI